jgi:ligand-binding SRPBCC domain-containing protein
MAHLNCSLVVPGPIKEVYDYLCDPKRVPQLLEGHVEVEVLNAEPDLQKGAEFTYLMTRVGISQQVRFRVEEVTRGTTLVYRQTEGVFRKWVHTQKFSTHGKNETLVTDVVDYELPFGLVGHLLDDLLFRRDLRRILEDRLKKAVFHFQGLHQGEDLEPAASV